MVDRPLVKPKASIEILTITEESVEPIDKNQLTEFENNVIRVLTNIENPDQLERLDTVFIDKIKSSFPKHTTHQVKIRIDSSEKTLTSEQVEETLKAINKSLTILNISTDDSIDSEPIQWQFIARTEQVLG